MSMRRLLLKFCIYLIFLNMNSSSFSFTTIASPNCVKYRNVPDILRNVVIQDVNKALVHITDFDPLNSKLGYLQGRDCCGHNKLMKLHGRMTRIRLVTIHRWYLVIPHVLFAYLLNGTAILNLLVNFETDSTTDLY